MSNLFKVLFGNRRKKEDFRSFRIPLGIIFFRNCLFPDCQSLDFILRGEVSIALKLWNHQPMPLKRLNLTLIKRWKTNFR